MSSEDAEDVEEAPADALRHLRVRRNELAQRRSRFQRLYYTLIGAGVLMFFMSVYFAWRFRDQTLAPVFIVYALSPLALSPTFRMRLRDVEGDLQEIDFQIDLRQFEVSKSESRAEKVLRLNEFQLRRYYDMNLSQNFWVFSLGLFCILLGVAVIGVTLYLVLAVAKTASSQAITAALGGVGSLLTNFIAAIYLKMNSSAAANLTAFHTKLVETHQLLLANLLASRIEDEEKRWDTLASLAVGLATPKRNERSE